jgi:hypothetical protein
VTRSTAAAEFGLAQLLLCTNERSRFNADDQLLDRRDRGALRCRFSKWPGGVGVGLLAPDLGEVLERVLRRLLPGQEATESH